MKRIIVFLFSGLCFIPLYAAQQSYDYTSLINQINSSNTATIGQVNSTETYVLATARDQINSSMTITVPRLVNSTYSVVQSSFNNVDANKLDKTTFFSSMTTVELQYMKKTANATFQMNSYGINTSSDITEVKAIRWSDNSVSTTAANITTGDMNRSTYDTGSVGKVDTALNAEKLNNQSAGYYGTMTSTNSCPSYQAFTSSMASIQAERVLYTSFYSSMTSIQNERVLYTTFYSSMTSLQNERLLISVHNTSMTAIENNYSTVNSSFGALDTNKTDKSVFVSSMASIQNERLLISVHNSSMTSIQTERLLITVHNTSMTAIELNYTQTASSFNSVDANKLDKTTFLSSMTAINTQTMYKSSATMSGQFTAALSTAAAISPTRFTGQMICSNGAETLAANGTTVINTGAITVKSFVFNPTSDKVANIHIDSVSGGSVTMHNTDAGTVDIYWWAFVVQ